MYRLIRDNGKIKSLQNKFSDIIKNYKGVKRIEGCTVGHPGGSFKNVTLYWLQDHGFWLLPDRPTSRKVYWNALGREFPDKRGSLNITVELNFAFDGNRRPGGCFFMDENGSFYIGHRGNIKRGCTYIGKEEFFGMYKGDIFDVEYEENKFEPVAAVARFDDTNFIQAVAEFVRRVDEIKEILNGRR